MGIYQGIKDFLKRCDLLACTPTLRVRGSAAYQSVFGGFVSIAVMSFFIYLFILKIIEVVENVNISSDLTQADKI